MKKKAPPVIAINAGTIISPLMPRSAARLRTGGNIMMTPATAVIALGMVRLNISARRTNRALAPAVSFHHAATNDNAQAICQSRQGLVR